MNDDVDQILRRITVKKTDVKGGSHFSDSTRGSNLPMLAGPTEEEGNYGPTLWVEVTGVAFRGPVRRVKIRRVVDTGTHILINQSILVVGLNCQLVIIHAGPRP